MDAGPVLLPFPRPRGAPAISSDDRQSLRAGSVRAAPPDEEARRIVAAVLAGDRQAFNVLVERESAALVRVCHRVLGDLHDAEDAAQEAFVTAYRALGTWRGDGPFAAWLARIGLRVALRQASRRRSVVWLDPTDPAGAHLYLPASEQLEPPTRALAGERHERVRRAVGALDEPYREVVAMRFFGELTLEEIATQTGRPLGTVKTHLHRGLARLRASLEEVAE